MDMPGDGFVPLVGVSYWSYELSKSVLNGSVPLERMNDMVTRVVATWYQLGQDKDYPLPNFSSNTQDATGPCYPGSLFSPTCTTNEYVNVQGDHATVARQISREAITMLKNDNQTLPLAINATLRVFGSDAQISSDGINACIDSSCNKGVLGMGWGSGAVNYPYLDSPIDAIMRKSSNVEYYSSDSFPSSPKAAVGDIGIVFLSSDSGENSYTVEGNHGDRDSSGLYAWHKGDALVKAAAAKYSTVIVVVHTVGPLLLENWISLPSVKAVLIAHLPGQEAGDSLTDILFGDYSPSGHLPYSIPVKESDFPDSVSLRGFALGQVQDTFSEGLYIDYRYLNKQKIAPRYAFGYGLSYTNFSFTDAGIEHVDTLSTNPPAREPKGSTPIYSSSIPSAAEVAWPTGFKKLLSYIYPYLDNPSSITSSTKYPYPAGYSTTPKPDPPAGGAQGGNPALWDVMFRVSVKVSNTGTTSYSGKTVAMLFVQFPEGTQAQWDTPIVQLRAFEKTKTLAKGESQVVQLEITRKDLSVWDVLSQNWVVPGVGEGEGFKFWIGESSDDLKTVCDSLEETCESGVTPPV
jgi:beta-glucosidase